MQDAPYHGVSYNTTIGQLQHNFPEYTLQRGQLQHLCLNNYIITLLLIEGNKS